MQTTTTIKQQHNCYTNSDSPVCYKASYDGGVLQLRKFGVCAICYQVTDISKEVIGDVDLRVESDEKRVVLSLTIRGRDKPTTIELPLVVG